MRVEDEPERNAKQVRKGESDGSVQAVTQGTFLLDNTGGGFSRRKETKGVAIPFLSL